MTSLEAVPFQPTRGSFHRELITIVKAGRAAQKADPRYGTEAEPESLKLGFRLGRTYADQPGAIGALRRANSDYSREFKGEFQGYSEPVSKTSKRHYLVIRFVPENEHGVTGGVGEWLA